MSPADEVTEVAIRVAGALERASVEYMVGGSVASSAHGEPRATRDIDFVIRLTESAIGALVEALGSDFAVDEAMILEAVRTGRRANLSFPCSPRSICS